MSNYIKLLNNLETLKLFKIKENLDTYIELINSKEKDVVNTLYELTKLEIDVMIEKKAKHSIQFAGFPYYKTFEDFDFTFQPAINREQILDFKNLRFIDKKENILSGFVFLSFSLTSFVGAMKYLTNIAILGYIAVALLLISLILFIVSEKSRSNQ